MVLKDDIPYTRDVVYFDFASGRGIESLKRHLRECAGDYSLVLCLFFPDPPPNPFPVSPLDYSGQGVSYVSGVEVSAGVSGCHTSAA